MAYLSSDILKLYAKREVGTHFVPLTPPPYSLQFPPLHLHQSTLTYAIVLLWGNYCLRIPSGCKHPTPSPLERIKTASKRLFPTGHSKSTPISKTSQNSFKAFLEGVDIFTT